MVRLLVRVLLGLLVLALLAQLLLWWQVSRWAAATARVARSTWRGSGINAARFR